MSLKLDSLVLNLPKFQYETMFGKAYLGDSLELLDLVPDDSIDLAITSPPFVLLRQTE